MHLPTAEEIQEYVTVAGPTLAFMLAVSVLVVAVAIERALATRRMRRLLARVDERVMEPARKGDIEEARRTCEGIPSPVREVFVSGLDRALGRVRGEPSSAMKREMRRAVGQLKAWTWTLGTAGALMPFAGLLGTVLGVMGSFRAIGESGSGGFAVVSAGISEALIATAAGLFVAIEAVFFFNVLQNAAAGVARDLGLLVDELTEILAARRGEHAGSAAK
jgi:biopolymer transport protein ExbB